MKIKMILAALLCSAALVSAQSTATHFAILDPLQDGGGTRTGSGRIDATLDGSSFAFNGSFSGLSGTVLDGGFHIHGPALPGQNAGILYFLYPTMTLNPDMKSGTVNGAITVASQAQLNQLNSGMWYFNIHTSTHGGGEIRGQILPVPEPSTWALMGFGAMGMIWYLRRKRSA